MKRDIKFRAWDKENGCWVSIDSVALCDDGSVAYLLSADGEPPYLEEEVELMEWTGLKDVHGKPIYEGDIVHGYDQEPDRDDHYIGSSVIDVVNFKYGAFWIGDSWYKVMVMTPPIIEVIGNVHTNPELLEVEK